MQLNEKLLLEFLNNKIESLASTYFSLGDSEYCRKFSAFIIDDDISYERNLDKEDKEGIILELVKLTDKISEPHLLKAMYNYLNNSPKWFAYKISRKVNDFNHKAYLKRQYEKLLSENIDKNNEHSKDLISSNLPTINNECTDVGLLSKKEFEDLTITLYRKIGSYRLNYLISNSFNKIENDELIYGIFDLFLNPKKYSAEDKQKIADVFNSIAENHKNTYDKK